MDWHHAPLHRLADAGAYMITAGTYLKRHYFRDPDRLSFLRNQIFEIAKQYDWWLQAWAIFSNDYHFVGFSEKPQTLSEMVNQLHSLSSREINKLDGSPGRQVWYQYWDTHLTYERSYMARLNYVHNKPVHHGLVTDATRYPWCSGCVVSGEG